MRPCVGWLCVWLCVKDASLVESVSFVYCDIKEINGLCTDLEFQWSVKVCCFDCLNDHHPDWYRSLHDHHVIINQPAPEGVDL